MKIESGSLVCLTTIVVNLVGSASAGEIVRDNVAITLNDTTAWVGGVPPGANDIARWDNTVATAANTTAALGADTAWDGIKVVNPAANVVISAGNTLTLDGGAGQGTGIDVTSTRDLTITAPLVLTGNQTWNVGTGRFVTINGATPFNQGSSGITLNGAGQVAFAFGDAVAPGSGTGVITVNKGILRVETTNGAAFPGNTDVISPTTGLAMGGGTFHGHVGNSVGTYIQNFSGLTLNAGGSVATQSRGSSSLVIASFGTVSRSVGGTINLQPTTNNSGFRLGTGTFPVELVSGGVVLNGADFVRANAAATNMGAASYLADTWDPANETNVTIDSNPANATTNALRFGTLGARTLTLTGTNTITSGGLLVNGTVAANTTTITGGILRGRAGTDLVVHQFNTAGSLNIASEIADNTSATALTKTGGGTLVLSGNNTFTGGVYLNQGNLQLANPAALNATTPNALTFTNNSSAKLQLGGVSATASSLNTTGVIALIAPIVENANAADATLTVSNTASSNYAGTLQDGTGGGKLGIAKSGAGVLTLSGVSTAYTGNTTVNLGTLALSGTAVPGTANTVTVAGGATLDVTARTGGSLTIANGQNLTGSGSVDGTIVTGAGSIVTPGSSIGTLSADSLTVGGGSIFNFEFNGLASDLITVTNADGLTINGGGFNLFIEGTSNKLQTPGTYKLFQYTGTIQGAGVAALSSANILNPQGGLTYQFQESGGFVELVVGGTPAVVSEWTSSGTGGWQTPGNWTAGVPNGAGDTAQFGSLASDLTVGLNGNRTLGALEFNNPNAYLIDEGTGGILSFNNGVSNASLNVINGSHSVTTPITLESTTAITVTNAASTLTLSGLIADGASSKGLVKLGAGTLDLTGIANTYSGDTTVSGGTVQIGSLDSLGLGNIFLASGGIKWATGIADDISTRVVELGSGGGTFDTNGNDVAFAGAIGNGGAGSLTKSGLGSLTLAGGNDHTGGTVIKAGTLLIADDSSFGAIPGSPEINVTFNPGTGNTATLASTATATIDTNRSISMSSGIARFDTTLGDITYSGQFFGTGRLNKSGAGVLTLFGVNNVNATGGTTIDGGTLFVNNEVNLPSGGLIMNNAILSTNGVSFSAPVVSGVNEVIERPGGSGAITSIGALSGSGTFKVTNGFVTDYTASLLGFNGTLVLGGGTRFNGTAGNAAMTLDLVNHGLSVRNGATALAIGAIVSPDPAGFLGGSTGGGVQTVTWSVGALDSIPSLFGGIIGNGGGPTALTKVGTNSLTLSGASTHTGATNVNAGTLIFNGASFSASPTTVAGSAALTGNGTLAALNVSFGGLLSPGVAGIGTLNAGNTAMHGTLQVEVDETTATADTLAVVGNLDFVGGIIDFSVLNGPLTQPAYVFASYTTINGAPFEDNVPAGYRVDYTYQGLNQIALTTAPASAFDTWAASFNLFGGDATETADFDGDGVNNLLEFVLGGDPTVRENDLMPTVEVTATDLIFSFDRSDESQSFGTQVVEFGSDLANWTTVPISPAGVLPVGVTVGIQENAGDPDRVTVTIARGTSTALFARFKANP